MSDGTDAATAPVPGADASGNDDSSSSEEEELEPKRGMFQCFHCNTYAYGTNLFQCHLCHRLRCRYGCENGGCACNDHPARRCGRCTLEVCSACRSGVVHHDSGKHAVMCNECMQKTGALSVTAFGRRNEVKATAAKPLICLVCRTSFPPTGRTFDYVMAKTCKTCVDSVVCFNCLSGYEDRCAAEQKCALCRAPWTSMLN